MELCTKAADSPNVHDFDELEVNVFPVAIDEQGVPGFRGPPLVLELFPTYAAHFNEPLDDRSLKFVLGLREAYLPKVGGTRLWKHDRGQRTIGLRRHDTIIRHLSVPCSGTLARRRGRLSASTGPR